MNFIPKVPLAPSKCLSKWIKLDKLDHFQNGSQDFFLSFLFWFSFIFLNMKPLSEVAPGLLVIQIQIQAVWATHHPGFTSTARLSPRASLNHTSKSSNFLGVNLHSFFQKEQHNGFNLEDCIVLRWLWQRRVRKVLHIEWQLLWLFTERP